MINGWREGQITKMSKGIGCEGVLIECEGKAYGWGNQKIGKYHVGDKVKIMFYGGKISFDAGFRLIESEG